LFRVAHIGPIDERAIEAATGERRAHILREAGRFDLGLQERQHHVVLGRGSKHAHER
jgi:hypothetical protein